MSRTVSGGRESGAGGGAPGAGAGGGGRRVAEHRKVEVLHQVPEVALGFGGERPVGEDGKGQDRYLRLEEHRVEPKPGYRCDAAERSAARCRDGREQSAPPPRLGTTRRPPGGSAGTAATALPVNAGRKSAQPLRRDNGSVG